MKHDCAEVFELLADPIGYRTSAGEIVELEDELVFPLLKGADLTTPRPEPRRAILVPVRSLKKEPLDLARVAPKADAYLRARVDRLRARKSSVFAGRPPFSLFGIGEYSFAPYKVAIGGLSKRLSFAVVGPHGGKPVLFDDTTYFLPFWTAGEAEHARRALESTLARSFFEARTSWDAKRPITKRLLDALSLERVREALTSIEASPTR